jgi:hypothetical protein
VVKKVISKSNIHRLVDKGEKIYQSIKANYDPKERGKFLAIEVDSKSAYLDKTSAGALVKARKNHPNKLFYVAKVGFDVAETVAHSLIFKS